ncbi:hypothetical protein FRC12_002471 [Ceratobasidium sp. 428]|nr:hypothetical protein FRC12_002471 [Ceratobasidium sp. 428]
MEMASFNTLPDDILLAILFLLPGISIRQCLQVSHRLKDIIHASGHLRYLVELDICGYIKPDCLRTDLSYEEMAELLRCQRARWDNPQDVMPTYYELPLGEPVRSCPFTKGVLARIVGRIGYPIEQIRFYQLPSKNRGVKFEHWSIDQGISFLDFFIDPDQDLLIGFEPVGSPPSTTKVHVKSMRTGKDHPQATGQFVLMRDFYNEHRLSSIEIIGHSLAVFGWPHGRVGYHIEIWDWTTGSQLSYLTLDDMRVSEAQLLSEDSFVICHSPWRRTIADFPKGTLGCLNVYQFGLHPTMPAKATKVASFALPSREDATVTYQFAPSTSTPNHGCSVPKIYELEPQDRLVHIIISSNSYQPGDIPRPIARGFYTLAVSVLLDMLLEPGPSVLENFSCILFPWSDWANKAFWIPWDNSEYTPDLHLSGRRSVTLAGYDLNILDFRGQLTTRNIDVFGPDIDSISDFRSKQKQGKQASLCTIVAEPIEERSQPRMGFSVDIDDEHVIAFEVFLSSVL